MQKTLTRIATLQAEDHRQIPVSMSLENTSPVTTATTTDTTSRLTSNVDLLPRPIRVIKAILYTPSYTDCTLLVGPNEETYHLHRHILTVHSHFLKLAFTNASFKESREKSVKLPDLSSSAMTPILEWMYKSPFTIPKEAKSSSAELFRFYTGVYNAVDFLQMDKLKTVVMDLIKHALWECPRPAPREAFDLVLAIYASGGVLTEMAMDNFVRRAGSAKGQPLIGWIEEMDGSQMDVLKLITGVALRIAFTR